MLRSIAKLALLEESGGSAQGGPNPRNESDRELERKREKCVREKEREKNKFDEILWQTEGTRKKGARDPRKREKGVHPARTRK